ncbi:hypothetical protein B0H17DRAFT_1087534 [Mycena rosella]|uniref:Uncharacterized protein n=1 Tax=Mycena rosella TaxID=1033263 RepID=A0AAD7CXV0_MYCRO|nr:hypothetical protein B0H17DRAFT_1087534 [Mycena rosella]
MGRCGEDRNFLRFATALKILVGSSIRIQSTDPPQGLEKAEKLLRDYLLGFSELYGPEEMKPNHHWAVHIPDQVRDYGPLYSFWAFLTDTGGKSQRINNWTGGLLEVSMMREFHRTAQLDGVLNGILDETSGPEKPLAMRLEHQFIRLLFGTGENKEALGTIEDAAAHERESTRVLAGSIAARAERIQNDGMHLGLVNYYNRHEHKVHLTRARPAEGNSQMLGSFAETYDYILPDLHPPHAQNGFQFNGEPYAREIRVIFRHKQTEVPSSEDTLLAFVAWMKPSTKTPLDDDEFIWYDFPELSVDTWLYNTYAQANDTDCPPCVLPLANIQCQVARGKIGYTDPPLSLVRFWLMEWATAPERKNKLCC